MRASATRMVLGALLALAGLLALPAAGNAALGTISTVAGNGSMGSWGDGGQATLAALSSPSGVATSGGTFYIAESGSSRVRFVDAAGVISTYAGTSSGFSGDGGTATLAQFNGIYDLAYSGGRLFVPDFNNHRVRVISSSGVVTTFAGGGISAPNGVSATTATLTSPAGVTVDAAGNVYVADTGAHKVFKVTPGGTIWTVAGTGTSGNTGDGGPATAATLTSPGDVVVEDDGDLLISDYGAHVIRRVTPAGTISRYAGNGTSSFSGDGGPAASAGMSAPWGMVVDGRGRVYVATIGDQRIRRIDTTGTITTVAGKAPPPGYSGDGGPATSAQLKSPMQLAFTPTGDLLFADTGNHRVRRVEALGGPDAPVPSSTAPASPGNDTAPRILGSAVAGTTVKLYTNSTCTSAVAASGTAAAFASPGLAVSVPTDATTTFWATSTDAYGAVSACSTASVAYVEDSTPPPAPALDAKPSTPGSDATPTWEFSSAGADGFECRVERGSTVVADWANCATPKTPDLSGEPDGTYTFRVRARDAAGNRSAATPGSYVLDTTAPAAPAITGAAASPGAATSAAWSFTGEAGAVLTCRLERGATVVSDWDPCSSPRTYDLDGKPDGTYAFSVRAKDAAGNLGPAATRSYQLDTTAPAAPALDATPGAAGRNRNPTWGFSGEADATFECRLDRGATEVSGWAPCDDTRSYDLAGEADGPYVFSVRARDEAGNRGPATTSPYALDTTGPAPPSLGYGPGPTGHDRTPEWDFSGEAGATYECRLQRGATVLDDWAACSDPAGYDLAGELDGTVTFRVRATDAAGNTGADAEADYVLDTVAPSAPVLATTPPATGADTTPRWTFTGDAGATFHCRIMQGATVVEGWAACTSPYDADLSQLSDGTYEVEFRSVDAAGNASAATPGTYTLDTAAAVAPTITGDPGASGRDQTPTWSFTGDSDVTFQCKLSRGATVVADFATCTSARTYDLSAQLDGTYTFAVVAIDAAGNSSPAATQSYALDATAPAAPSLPTVPGATGKDSTPTWGFSGEADATYECRLVRGGDTLVSDWDPCTSPRTYDLSTRPDDTYTFSVRATDALGNLGPAAIDTYVYDATAPAAPAITPPPSPRANRTPVWGLTTEAGARLECRLDRGVTEISAWEPCGAAPSYDLSGRPDDGYTLTAHAIDAAGNQGPDATSTYVLDTAAPAAPVLGPLPASPGLDDTPTWSFSSEAGATFQCRLARGATLISDWATCPSPRTYDLSAELDGTYAFAVRARDAAGNTGPEVSTAYVLDTTAPAGPTITDSPGASGRDVTPTWAFTGDAGTTLECRLERAGTVIGDWDDCSDSRTYDLSTESDGTYAFRVRATDNAGNVGPAAVELYSLDHSPPAAPALGTGPGSVGHDETPTWSFSSEPAATFECRLERGAVALSGWSSCTNPRTYDLSDETDGTYVFSVRATDAAGNVGGEATTSYALDTVAPADPTILTRPAAITNVATPAWTFSAPPGVVVECRVEGGGLPADWTTCEDSHTAALGPHPDGRYDFYVRTRDAAGNESAPASDTLTLDRVSPLPPVLSGGPPAVGHDAVPTWTIAAEGGASLSCRLERASMVVRDWATCTTPHAEDLSSLGDGEYVVLVRATDAATNTGSAASAAYRLDMTAPAPPAIMSPPPAVSTGTSPSWAFSGEAGARFECRVTGPSGLLASWAPCASPWVYHLAGQSDGIYVFEARQVDIAGNAGTTAASTYELDRTGPPAPEILTRPDSPAHDANPTWTFAGEPGAPLECQLTRGTTVVSAWAACDGSWTYDLLLEPAGTYQFAVRAVDAVGNRGTAAVAEYEYRLAEAPSDDPTGDGAAAEPGAGADPGAGLEAAAPVSTDTALAREETEQAADDDDAADKAEATAPGAHDPDRGRPVLGPRDESADAPASERSPDGSPRSFAGRLASAVGHEIAKAARVVVENADKSVFPGSLLLVVGGFLAVQNQIDRRDPKLALAPLSADTDLEFEPLPT